MDKLDETGLEAARIVAREWLPKAECSANATYPCHRVQPYSSKSCTCEGLAKRILVTYLSACKLSESGATKGEWQPIESAPKDGTRIQLMATINTARFAKLPPIGWIKVGKWSAHYQDGYAEGWREDAVGGNGDLSRLKLVPTHWLPLPPASPKE